MPTTESLPIQSRLYKILRLPIRNPDHLRILEEFHLPRRRCDLLDLLLLSLVRTALSGSVPAFKELRDIAQLDSSLLLYQRLDHILEQLQPSAPPPSTFDAT